MDPVKGIFFNDFRYFIFFISIPIIITTKLPFYRIIHITMLNRIIPDIMKPRIIGFFIGNTCVPIVVEYFLMECILECTNRVGACIDTVNALQRNILFDPKCSKPVDITDNIN